MFAWLVLAVLLTLGCSWLTDLVLWAQEGALSQEEQLLKQREKAQALSKSTSTPAAAVAAAGPQVTYEEAPRPGQVAAAHRANMNWSALYLVLAVPTTYFVFRGAAH
jgi:hypothetical protein